MRFVAPQTLPLLARWTSRLALFAVLLILTAIFLHRLFGMPTPVALNVVTFAFALALLALVVGLGAFVEIWRNGGPGTARSVFGVLLSLALLSLPVAALPLARQFPPINDISTDVTSPPPFNALAKQRSGQANSAVYPGPESAEQQKAAFPDLKPLVIDRTRQEAFELVVDAMKRLGMTLVSEQSPGADSPQPGLIEAVDRTLVLGFYDDVAVRVDGSDGRARVDLRSASRFGTYDFGRNAERIRAMMKEIAARVDATVPTASDDLTAAAKARDAKGLKQGKVRNPRSVVRRTLKGRVPQDAQRGLAPKGSPPPRASGPARDKQ